MVQPIFLVVLHSILTHGRLVPFRIPRSTRKVTAITVTETKTGEIKERVTERPLVQALPRRPLASLFWLATFALGAVLVNEAHQTVRGITPDVLARGSQAFYLGWILLWISPVIGWLTWLGGRLGRQAWKAWAIGSALMCAVDT